MPADTRKPENMRGSLHAVRTGSAAWLPIQLAPKDGTRIMLWCGDEVEIGYWSMSGWVTKPDGNGGLIGAWIIYENRSDTIELAPTHWQPLPMPPDASIKPQMSDEELANKLMCVLTQEMICKSELFDYLCWLEEKEQGERVPEADFLVLASDGRTCWGKSYAAAVAAAMEYDAKPYGEHQNMN